VIRVVFGKSSTAETWQIAGESLDEVTYQSFPGDVAVVRRPVYQDQGWTLSVYPSGDLGAVSRIRPVDPLISHAGLFCRTLSAIEVVVKRRSPTRRAGLRILSHGVVAIANPVDPVDRPPD
jgi:hypothetical protein